MKWRIRKRRMKSSKRRDQKFERASGELNITDCVDQIKFYLCLSVRKASSISKKVNFKCKLVFLFSKNQPRHSKSKPRNLKRKCVFPKINRGIWNLNQRICYLNLFFFSSKCNQGKENKREREDTEGETSKKRRFQWVRKTSTYLFNEFSRFQWVRKHKKKFN